MPGLPGNPESCGHLYGSGKVVWEDLVIMTAR